MAKANNIQITYGSGRVGDPTFANTITAQDGQLRPDRTPYGRNFRVTHAGDKIPFFPRMDVGYAHHGPNYFISTTFDVSSVPGLDENNASTVLPPLLPVATPGDVTRVNTPDVEVDVPPTTDLRVIIQQNFDHGFYFNLISACVDDVPFNLYFRRDLVR